jgi:hypothetical protein
MDESFLNTLAQTAEAVAKAKSILASCRLPNELRTSKALEIFREMLQEHETVLQSCRNAEFHSAISQGRRIMEHLVQGIWLSSCAADSQIADRSLEQIIPSSVLQMVKDLDTSCPVDGDFEELRRHVWRILGKCADFELKEAGRHKTRRGIEPPYTDEEIIYAGMTSTTCVLLLAKALLKISGYIEESLKVEVV